MPEAHRVRRERAVGGVVVALEDVSVVGDRGALAVEGVSLEVKAGEIVGVAGVAGNGQRELAEAVTGIRDLAHGTIRVDGRELHSGDPRSAIAAGVAYVPEDRLGTGLAPSLSIAQNVALKRYRRCPRVPRAASPHPTNARARSGADPPVRREGARPGHAGSESVGREPAEARSREGVRGRAARPVAAQPTRGLDVGAIETVHGFLRDASSRGVAVLMISEDLDELMALSDRIVVMYEGSIAGEVDPEAATIEEIGLLMAGGGAE